MLCFPCVLKYALLLGYFVVQKNPRSGFGSLCLCVSVVKEFFLCPCFVAFENQSSFPDCLVAGWTHGNEIKTTTKIKTKSETKQKSGSGGAGAAGRIEGRTGFGGEDDARTTLGQPLSASP